MNMQPILSFAHSLINKAVSEGDSVIDATVGNGHDTVFLAKLVGESGHVFGFDVQETAIQNTTKRLQAEKVDHRVTLFHKGHETILDSIPETAHSTITGAIFNLGYLPHSDKNITTKPNTTIMAIEQILQMMQAGGIIVLVVYHGHEEGVIEKEQVLEYVQHLDQQVAHVLQYGFINQKNNPPFVIAIEKRK
ncbi:methyltransferase domain-containing protein [Bacillus ginsengihumi]|uniref:Methyltransferase domain-containing protein n=1 Tax=Heyndrickxia ginsengihumi TaxID=363870 RepID=A0A6M0PC11_9BACI|nr:class I SAM-dependent methyltransferase [Heyndrickxia ginsengihumi]NEY21008.1 methyltransferase domain-containing protein [Heyndrickxia ginsengihumi]